MGLRQKLGLAGIFSLTVFIMIVAIVRATVVRADGEQTDQTWLYTWHNVEQIVGKKTTPPDAATCRPDLASSSSLTILRGW